MPYNRTDYEGLIQGAGLVPVKDLLAYRMSRFVPLPERFGRIVSRRLERSGVRLRPLDFSDFGRELEVLRDLYNRSWERNWGFVPATDAEFEHAAKDLKALVDRGLSCVAERRGTPLGFSVFLHDLNVLLRGSNGRLFPTLWWRLLFGLRKVPVSRCVLLGVVPEARGLAIVEAFFVHAYEAGVRLPRDAAECSWILEDNRAMRGALEAAGAPLVKRYRLYETP
jgi:hypothetical protein